MSAAVLYLSFDGMTDPLGRSQVVPYLAGLARRGHLIRIVSLEKRSSYSAGAAAVDKICRESGLEWYPVRYFERPPVISTLVNLWILRRKSLHLLRKARADFTHCRSDLPGLVGLWLKRRFGLSLLYDMRAFWPDERAEGVQWDQAKWLYRLIFRYFKCRQRDLLENADEVVTLSEEGLDAVRGMGVRDRKHPISVIPCCADFALFAPVNQDQRSAARAELGVEPAAPLLVHVGSIGCNCLLDEMLDFFAIYRQRHPTAQFLFLAPGGESEIRAATRQRGIEDAVHVRSARREEVPQWIGAADVGIMFVRPVWSKKAASPTKLGEMLAIGLPVIANSGVGDVAQILRDTGAGMVLDQFDADSYAAAVEALDRSALSQRQIRNAGRRWFDLEIGINRYDAIYRRLAG